MKQFFNNNFFLRSAIIFIIFIGISVILFLAYFSTSQSNELFEARRQSLLLRDEWHMLETATERLLTSEDIASAHQDWISKIDEYILAIRTFSNIKIVLRLSAANPRLKQRLWEINKLGEFYVTRSKQINRMISKFLENEGSAEGNNLLTQLGKQLSIADPDFKYENIKLLTDSIKYFASPSTVFSRNILSQIIDTISEDIKNQQDMIIFLFILSSLIITITTLAIVFYANRLLHKNERKIYKLQKYLSNIINSMPSVLIGVNKNGEITQWNNTAEKVTGIPAEQAYNKELITLLPTFISDIAKIKESIDNGQAKFEAKRMRKDNEKVIYEDLTIYPLVTNGVEGAVIRLDDVTEQVQMSEIMFQKEKMNSIGQLTGGIAHDFNNMLGGIMGAAEIIEQLIEPESKQYKYIQIIINAAEKASQLTQKLLNFSRKGQRLVSDFSIHSAINEMLVLFERSLNKKIRIKTDLSAEFDFIQGDVSQIQNMLLNLALNARDAMPEGGEFFIATSNMDLDKISCEKSGFNAEPGQYVEILVRDSGIGMDKQTAQKIFDPFFTTKSQGKGTGLGLASVYGTVVEHKGIIYVYSEPEMGTVFKIYLKVGTGASRKLKSPSNKVIQGSGCIMIIDDEDMVRMTAEVMLKTIGYDVISAHGGLDGLRLYKENKSKVSLVLLDMIMPDISGRETFVKLKEINHDIRVIITSGFSSETDINFLIKAGCLDFIQKPYRLVELSAKINKALK